MGCPPARRTGLRHKSDEVILRGGRRHHLQAAHVFAAEAFGGHGEGNAIARHKARVDHGRGIVPRVAAADRNRPQQSSAKALLCIRDAPPSLTASSKEPPVKCTSWPISAKTTAMPVSWQTGSPARARRACFHTGRREWNGRERFPHAVTRTQSMLPNRRGGCGWLPHRGKLPPL